MKNLKQIIKEAENKKIAIGHFNIAELSGLKAIFAASQEASLAFKGRAAHSDRGEPRQRREASRGLKIPLIIGTSEGEANFIGRKQAAALIKSLREEHDYPIFLNSDHTHSLEEVKKAVEAGYDAILFDGGKLPFEENIRQTKKIVKYVRSKNPKILIEGELGYIGGSSQILKEIPKGAAIKKEDLTKPEDAAKFVKETGVDLLAPAVGNLHGMFGKAKNPDLDIKRIKDIRKAAGVPLVLHGGSGIKDKDFIAAIKAGISIIHISTELRVAWRKGLEKGLAVNSEELAAYKLLPEAIAEVKNVVVSRLKLFTNYSQPL